MIGPGYVYVSRAGDHGAWVGIRSERSSALTQPAYEALKAFVRGLGYVVSDEGKPGTVGHQSFRATRKQED